MWTRHCRSSRACPTTFIALSVHHMFVQPMALLEFQSVPCPCLPGWGKSCGPRFWALPPRVTAHMILSLGRGVHVVFHVWVLRYHGCACMCWPLLATHPWLRVPGVMEGSRCEKSEVSRFGCCHQPWRVLAVLRAEKPQWVLECWRGWGGRGGGLHHTMVALKLQQFQYNPKKFSLAPLA